MPQITESVGLRPLSQLQPGVLELDSEEDLASEITRLESEQQVVLSTLKERFDPVSGSPGAATHGVGVGGLIECSRTFSVTTCGCCVDMSKSMKLMWHSMQ